MVTMLEDSGNDRTATVSHDEDDSLGLGELLQRARDRRGLTLEQISNDTKIPRRHLEAIEADNLAAVPGGFYRRAQLRTFAHAVGLDETVALSRLERILGRASTETPPEAPPPVHASTTISGKRILVVIGVGVAAVVFFRSIGRQQPAVRDGQERTIADLPSPVVRGSPERADDAVVATSESTIPDPPMAPDAADPTAAPPAVQPDARPPIVADSNTSVSTEPTRPAANAFSELVVTTEPPGARVTVDGIGWGSSPATIRFLPAGSKRIRVIKEGYGSEERVITVSDGRRSTLGIRLRAAP
ncbi:MAG: helix-turn-helix domain-containing protein [Acidobacteriota bacterium]